MKTSAHTKYRNTAGEIVPGVTTVLGILNKPALVKWANNLGLQGIDSSKYVDDKAAIGTLAHAICTDHLMGIETDYSHYDQHQIDKAQNCALSFFNWLKDNPIKPIIIEGQFSWDFGGTVDIYCQHPNGEYQLIDLKTGSGIWPEYLYQIAAYAELLELHRFKVDSCWCLNIPRAETEAFLIKKYSDGELYYGYQIFQNCLNIYHAKKQLKHK